MLTQTNDNFRILFLLKFTAELIRSSGGEIFELEAALNDRKKGLKGEIEKVIEKSEESREENFVKPTEVLAKEMNLDKPFSDVIFSSRQAVPQRRFQGRRPLIAPLRIPEPRLPPRLQYLRPIPTNVQVDLGKLNVLVRDPMVKTIQCNGPGENIIVEGGMGTKPTAIILSEDEVDGVLDEFSKVARIPIDEGVVRIVVGRLILLAVISDVVSTKFVINKMVPGLMPPRRIPPRRF